MEENKTKIQNEEKILDAMEADAAELQDTILNGQCVAVPISVYEELIRAETERDIYEAALENDTYSSDKVRTAVRAARKARQATADQEDLM